MTSKRISRREFLSASALAGASIVVVACQAPSTPSGAPTGGETAVPPAAPPADQPATRFSEAPVLVDQTQTGGLPPVDERLPVTPAVVTPVEQVGEYGGTWRSVWRGVSDSRNLANHLRFARPIRLNIDTGYELFPDICDSWEASEDAMEYAFHLREGIMWSDGHPLTTDDVLFWWEDIIQNQEYTPAFPTALAPGGEPCTVEAVDSLTFIVRFSQTYGTFQLKLASNQGESWFTASPKHYLSQFHPSYVAKEELDQMVAAAKYETWIQLFGEKADWLMNPELPAMTAFIPKMAPDETGRAVWIRNPYYYKVDTAGNQLPYIDQVDFAQAGSADVAVLMAASGDVDLQIRYYRDVDFTPLKQNEQQGNYTVVPYYEMRGNTDATLNFNQTCSDPVLREVFGDVRFRQAASLAMNREEINKVAFLGLAKPRQNSFPTGSPYYDEEWANHYAEYDPDRANALLDEMGLTERDAEGFRLRPDGKTLEVLFEFERSDGKSTPLEELQKEYLDAIGVKTILQPRDRTLFTERLNTPDVQLTRWSFGGDFLNMPQDLLPQGTAGGWGTEWGRWFDSNGESGEEPPEDLLRVAELIDQALATADDGVRRTAVEEIVALWKKNLWSIGTVGENPRAGVVKNTLRNVPRDMPYGGYLSIPAPYAEQFYFES